MGFLSWVTFPDVSRIGSTVYNSSIISGERDRSTAIMYTYTYSSPMGTLERPKNQEITDNFSLKYQSFIFPISTLFMV